MFDVSVEEYVDMHWTVHSQGDQTSISTNTVAMHADRKDGSVIVKRRTLIIDKWEQGKKQIAAGTHLVCIFRLNPHTPDQLHATIT